MGPIDSIHAVAVAAAAKEIMEASGFKLFKGFQNKMPFVPGSRSFFKYGDLVVNEAHLPEKFFELSRAAVD